MIFNHCIEALGGRCYSAYHSNFDTSCIFIADAGLSRKLVAPFATASNITKACAELLSQQ